MISSQLLVQFWIFLQVIVRFSALVAIAPVFGARQIPAQVKVGLTVILSFAITPLLLGQSGIATVPDNLFAFISILVVNSMIGITMGFVVSITLAAFEIAGSLLDLQVGFTMAQTFNPAIGELAAPIGQFQYLYALLLFLLSNGHHIIIGALMKSFQLIPVKAFDLGSSQQFGVIANSSYEAILNGLKIAAPVGAVMLVMDISFAMMSRAMPQLNVFYVGMPAKVIAGLAIIVVVLPATAVFAGALITGTPEVLSGFVRGRLH